MRYQKYLLALAVCQAKGWQQQVEEMARGDVSSLTGIPLRARWNLLYFASLALEKGLSPDEATRLKAQAMIQRAQQIYGGQAA